MQQHISNKSLQEQQKNWRLREENMLFPDKPFVNVCSWHVTHSAWFHIEDMKDELQNTTLQRLTPKLFWDRKEKEKFTEQKSEIKR